MLFSILGVLLRVLLVLLVLRLVLRFAVAIARGYRGDRAAPAVTELVRDPVTGAYRLPARPGESAPRPPAGGSHG